MKPKVNIDSLVEKKVLVKISPPIHYRTFGIDKNSNPFSLPGTGGVTPNILVGDNVFGWQGDHVEPGVATIGIESDATTGRNSAYYFLPCIGNSAQITSGHAKGELGTVTGKHGGANHVIIDFPADMLERLCLEEKFVISAIGQGLCFINYPQITILNTSPILLDLLDIEEKNKRLYVPVNFVVPSFLTGSGIATMNMGLGDIDLMINDAEAMNLFQPRSLKLGDIIAIQDLYCNTAAMYVKGAISIGVVVHCDSKFPGHGPGVTVLFTDKTGALIPKISTLTNAGMLLKIGKFRPNKEG